jgi:DNA polymerase-4
MGINNGLDLKQLTRVEMIKKFGKVGHYYYQIARAEDPREVNPHRIRKSLGAENTFMTDLQNPESIEKELEKIQGILVKRMIKSGTIGKRLTLKVKYSDFQQITRSKTTHDWIKEEHQIKEIWKGMMHTFDIRNGIRLLGLTLSNLNHEENENDQSSIDPQLSLDF